MRKKLLDFMQGRFGIFVCIAILFPLLTAGTSSGTITRVVNGGGSILGASSLTMNFNVTGSNLILFVSTFKQNSETITGVTWNGVPLTQVESVISYTTNNVQLWYLLAPAVGTHDLVTTASGSSGYIITDYALYSGVKQTGQLDGSTRVTGNTPITATITTGTDNTWAFLTAVQGGSAGTNATLIAVGDKPTYDNQGYGTIAPGTAFSMTVNLQPGNPGGVIMATFKDATPPATPTPTPTPTAAVEVIATGLNGFSGFRLDGSDVYFTTNNGSLNGTTLKKVAKGGGLVTTLGSVAALNNPDSDASIANRFAVDSSDIYGGCGVSANFNLFKVPKGGGSVTNLKSISGAGTGFNGISGNYLYYSSGFSYINRMSKDGSGLTTLLSGYWVRSVAMDSTGIYFVDYNSKDVKKFDLNTSSLSTLISGNSGEGGVIIDSNNVYFDLSGTIKKVSKNGGAVTTLISGSSWIPGWISDDTYLYFGQDNAIKKIPVSGGTISTVTTDYTSSVSDMAVDDTYLYWGDTSGGTGAGKILRMPKSSTPTPTPTPTPTDTAAPSGSISINSGASYTNSSTVTVTLSATDSTGVTGYYLSDSSTTPSSSASGWTSVTSTTSYSASVSYTLSSGEGSKTIYAWYKDAAGNVSSTANATITLDTTAPIVTITSPTSSDTYTTTTSSPLSLGGSASDSTSGISNVTWANSKGGSGAASGTTNWSISNMSLSNGDNVITVTATDNAGNPGTDTITVIVPASTPAPSPTPTPATTPVPTPTTTEKGAIVGTVADEAAGVGITGAKITSDKGGYSATTGFDGYTIVDVSAGNYTLTASADGYKSSSQTVTVYAGEATVADFLLQRASVGMVFGFVLDENGDSLKGVTVTITNDKPQSTETDDNGYYEFSGIEAGEYTLTFEKSGYNDSTLDIILTTEEALEAETITMELEVKGSIFGYVVDIRGNPIESVKLKLKGLKTKIKKNAFSDADGFFEFADLEADKYVIFASKKRYKKTKQTVSLDEGDDQEIEIEMRKSSSSRKVIPEAKE